MRELLSREVSQGQPFTSLPIICSHTPCPWSLAEELVGLGKGVTPGSWSGRSWGRPQPSKPRGVWGPASSAGPWAQPSPGFLPACPLPPVVILEPALHPLVVCGCESECTPYRAATQAKASGKQLCKLNTLQKNKPKSSCQSVAGFTSHPGDLPGVTDEY